MDNKWRPPALQIVSMIIAIIALIVSILRILL